MWYVVIYSMEGRSPDAGREPVGNEGEIDTDYIRGPRVLLGNVTGW